MQHKLSRKSFPLANDFILQPLANVLIGWEGRCCREDKNSCLVYLIDSLVCLINKTQESQPEFIWLIDRLNKIVLTHY